MTETILRPDVSPEMASLMASLKNYCFPGGDATVCGVRGMRTSQRGEIRSGADARWNAFVAEEFVDATTSGFWWEARMGVGLTAVMGTDAYERGHGRLVVRKGPIELKKVVEPDVDRGELQRYLSYVGYCPQMLVNNPSLEWSAVGPRTLRIRDREAADTWVDLDLREDGCPLVIRATRPMAVAKRMIPTLWSATGSEPQEQDGLRVWRRMEAAWHPAERAFTYVRIELTSLTLMR